MSKDLAEIPESELADRMGAVKGRLDRADEDFEALKKEFDRRKLIAAKGSKFTVVKDVQKQMRVDMASLVAKVGQAIVDACKKPSSRTMYFVRPVEAAA